MLKQNMKSKLWIAVVTISLTTLVTGCGNSSPVEEFPHNQEVVVTEFEGQKRVELSREEWESRLTNEQFRILREQGTERAFTGKYTDNKKDGVYHCAGCGLELYDSKTKYDSGSGWPSFYDGIKEENIKLIEDQSHGMIRTELQCARCDGHLGHIFPDGPKPTGMRHCINSASLTFKER